MKFLLAIVFISFSTAAYSEDDCPLQGAWKSDAARTLADIASNGSFEPKSLNTISDEFFGHLNHEWTCTEFRAWFDDTEPGEAVPYEIVEESGGSITVVVRGDSKVELKIIWEGQCYKVFFQDRHFYEYFCPAS